MINDWLHEFQTSWLAKDIDRVMELFSSDVEYWETPYKKIKADLVRNEWKAILSQESIELNLRVYSSQEYKHTVLWDLSYTNEDSKKETWAGTYLVELNKESKCTYFYQTGEKYEVSL